MAKSNKVKVDKNSLEYIVSKLLYKDIIDGFQFTIGKTPRALKMNEPFTLDLSLNKTGDFGVVADSFERKVESLVFDEFFPGECNGDLEVSKEQLKSLQEQFKSLGYEVESATNFVGEWHWIRVNCKYDEIISHMNNIKENITF